MPTVEVFGIGQVGRSRVISSQSRQNCYLEIKGDPERGKVAVYGTPGLASFGQVDYPVRGAHVLNNELYVICGLAAGATAGYKFDVNGARTVLWVGASCNPANEGWLYSADDGTSVFWCDGDTKNTGWNGRLIHWNSSTSTYNSTTIAVLDDGYETITWVDGYLIAGDSLSKRFAISNVNTPLTWDALDFSSAESNPDRVVRVFANQGELIVFGTLSTEFWANSGGQDFPFTRIQGATCEWGLAAKRSLAKFDNTVAFLATNQQGQVMVARLNGYQPQRISNSDVDYEINKYGVIGDAQAFSYMVGGHQMYEITFPTADASWLYDASTGLWSRVKSYLLGRHRPQAALALSGKTIAIDYSNLQVYELTESASTDAGDPIEFSITTRHIAADNNQIVVDLVDLIAEVGVGSQAGSDPQIMMEVSKDGGRTWGSELWRSLGKIGETRKRVSWRRLGVGRDWTFRFKITDDCRRVLQNAVLQTRGGMS